MPRVLLATFGSLGDLHPYLAVGRALRERGIAARLAAAEEYRPAVEAAGLEYAPLRPHLATLGEPGEVARRLFDPLRGVERLIRHIVMPHLREAHADLREAARNADLFVSHPLTYALPMIAQQEGRPWLSSVLAPTSLLSRHDPPTLAGVDVLRLAHRLGPWAWSLAMAFSRRAVRQWEAPAHDLRTELGLAPSDAVLTFEGQFSPHGTLALFDPLLASPQPDWPPRTQLCGAALHDGPRPDAGTLGRLRAFLGAGDPPIVFALGSSAVLIAEDYWPRVIEAVRRLGRRALLLTGGRPLPPLPEGVVAFDYLPYSLVFPHAAVVVHQAGIGTLAQALRAGRPQLITPVAFDQPDNARRAEALGLARVLPFQRVRPAPLAAALSTLLREPGCERAARRVATELAEVDGARRAAAAIAALL